ncbi:Lar family restriction alleviation protein [Pseudomonas viridiflava]
MNNKPNDVLLPCPFCGAGDVKIVTADGCHFAQCRKCEATGPTGFKRGDEDDADWNSRAQAEPVGQWSDDDGISWCDGNESSLASARATGWLTRTLYRHAQPATAKVVLPDRRELSQSTPYLSDLDHEWNACLDEVAKLNTPQ